MVDEIVSIQLEMLSLSSLIPRFDKRFRDMQLIR